MLAQLWLGYKLGFALVGSTLVHLSSSSLPCTVFEVPSGTIDTTLGDGPGVPACAFAFDTDSPTMHDGVSICSIYEGESTCPIFKGGTTSPILVYEGQQDTNSPTMHNGEESICSSCEGRQDEEGHRVGGESVGPPPRNLLYWVSTYFDLEEESQHGSRSPVGYSDPNSWTFKFSSRLFCFASTFMRFYRWYCDELDFVLLGLPLAWLFGSVPSFVKFASIFYSCLEYIFGHAGRDLSAGKKDGKRDSNDFSWHSIARTVVGSIYFIWTAMLVLDCTGVPASCPIALLLYSGLAVIFGADFLDFHWVARWIGKSLLFGLVISINAAMILFHVGIFAACLSFDALRANQKLLYISIATTPRLVFLVIRYVFVCWINTPDTLPDGLYPLPLGDVEYLFISPTDTVAVVKNEIQSRFGVSTSNQKLFSRDGVLDDDKRTLASYGVDGSSTLILFCGHFGDLRRQDQVTSTVSADDLTLLFDGLVACSTLSFQCCLPLNYLQ